MKSDNQLQIDYPILGKFI